MMELTVSIVGQIATYARKLLLNLKSISLQPTRVVPGIDISNLFWISRI